MYDVNARLNAALRLLVSGQEFSEIPDIAAYGDVQSQWEAGLRDELAATIRDGNCTPRHTEIVDYPKSDIAVRPLARFSARDRLIYDSLIFELAADLDNFRKGQVYSYRWNHRIGRPIFWKDSWTLMRERAKRKLRSNRVFKLATTDVSSFYEHIDIDLLTDDLYLICQNETAIRNVSSFLKTFQNINHAWGLPQGSDASGILANAYLAPVDEYLERNEFPFFRYSDDIMIFHEDWNALRDALVDVNRIFRSKRLTMSAQKTKILDFPDALDTLKNARESSIDQALSTGDPDVDEDIRDYFDDLVHEERLDSSRMRFALNKLRRLGDDYAVGWCLDNLRFMAHAAREIFAYFAECAHRQREIQRKLTDFLLSSESSSYPYIEQRILRYFVRLEIGSEKAKGAAWDIMEDKNREEFPREFAVRYLGMNASASEAQLLRHKFEGEPSHTMRRALLVALYESGKLSERYLRNVEDSLPELRWTCRYLSGNPKVTTS
ncbi:RNA-directed DNA polymerase [Streptomyces sp. PDY-4]|uniref:Reverse transcriptase domain-containing protein n=1 Tax=Streptomyces fungicidicus TaxID=68203 RepID=A0A494V3N9_9ACTN|nr:RNA-directed DNA polymerase [Streptomyces fungicidicus]AYL37634.1 hypothetical protein CNQ36_20835 [Streptomyces fungicidicus]